MKRKTLHKNAGFTLIELMISMGVTLVLLYAAVAMFRDASQSNQVITQGTDMTDNLRAGLNLIQQDLQQAGTGIPTGGISIPYSSSGGACGTTAEPNRPTLLGSTQFRACNTTLPSIEPGFGIGPAVTAPDSATTNITDEVTILYADSTLGLDAKPINQPANPGPPAQPACNGTLTLSGTTLLVTFDATCVPLTQPGVTINSGDLIMFSNALGSTVMAVTSAAGNNVTFAAGDPFNLNGRVTDTSGTIWQLQPTGCGGAPACFPPTTATRIWMISYYLDNLTAPPYVRLIRRVNFTTPTPVGETLENLQFTYNFIDGGTNPANQPQIPTGNGESQIRSVNVLLAARSTYLVRKGATPVYARNNLVTQISLRSMAYYNKYQ